MQTKDQTLLEQAYQQVMESSRPNYQDDALKHPESYELYLITVTDEDWDGNVVYRTVADLYKVGIPKHSETFDNSDDIEELVGAFQQKNPEGIFDNRRDH